MVRVTGKLTDEMGERLVTGVMLDDGPARFAHISDQGGTGLNHWYLVRLSEGRNREVRRMFEAVGLVVSPADPGAVRRPRAAARPEARRKVRNEPGIGAGVAPSPEARAAEGGREGGVFTRPRQKVRAAKRPSITGSKEGKPGGWIRPYRSPASKGPWKRYPPLTLRDFPSNERKK